MIAMGTCSGVCHFDSALTAARYQLFFVLKIVHRLSVALIGNEEHELTASTTAPIVNSFRFTGALVSQ